jgi:peptidoglycan/xylan/chitin deacetylase (PgdA/CDA1 family)
MTGRLVISLDFEMMWGVRDHRSLADYGDAVLGEREAIPRMLGLFREYGIRATWATVGLLFARTRTEVLEHLPEVRPDYASERLSPYAFIAEGLGADERADPWHFGRSLIDRIAEVEGQEIGTHTFSHFCCLEKGHSVEAFAADLNAAHAIAAEAGHRPRSIVFPRNQFAAAYVAAAAERGVTVYRGNPQSLAYRPRARRGNTPWLRGLRLLDGVVPVSGRLDYDGAVRVDGAADVPASRFLRPYSPTYSRYSRLYVRNIQKEMRRAARDGKIYHLWWHPHNLGRNIAENIDQLTSILETYRDLRDRYGFASCNMVDIADAAVARP